MATDLMERVAADLFFGAGAIGATIPATWYLGLSTTQPNEDGSNFTEPTGVGSYARVAVVNNATNFPVAVTVSGVTTKTLATAATFPNPTANWALVPFAYYGWFIASTGGVPYLTNPLDIPITILNGNTPVQFAASQLIMVWD